MPFFAAANPGADATRSQDIQDVFATSNEAFADINEIFSESWSGEASMRPADYEAELNDLLGLEPGPEPPAPPPPQSEQPVRVPMAPLVPKSQPPKDNLPLPPNETPVLPTEDSSPPTYSNTGSRVCVLHLRFFCSYFVVWFAHLLFSVFVRARARASGFVEAAAAGLIVAATVGPLVAYAM